MHKRTKARSRQMGAHAQALEEGAGRVERGAAQQHRPAQLGAELVRGAHLAARYAAHHKHHHAPPLPLPRAAQG